VKKSRGLRGPRTAAGDEPTVPDLVVLSFLAARPRHGYDLWRELVRCEVQDWAGISRPHVYYSLKKCLRLGWLTQRAEPKAAKTRRPRRVLETSAAGRRALADALARLDWATQRPPSPFHTWICLSRHADAAARRDVVARRKAFLAAEIAKEKATLVAIENDPGPMQAIALWVVSLAIAQFETELARLESAPV
jgi:DNA-binding PadR family transcriptional regulator